VPVERIELPTFGLQNRCTTAVLHRPRQVGNSQKTAVQPDGTTTPMQFPFSSSHFALMDRRSIA
jgi:hypothetical protein